MFPLSLVGRNGKPFCIGCGLPGRGRIALKITKQKNRKTEKCKCKKPVSLADPASAR